MVDKRCLYSKKCKNYDPLTFGCQINKNPNLECYSPQGINDSGLAQNRGTLFRSLREEAEEWHDRFNEQNGS